MQDASTANNGESETIFTACGYEGIGTKQSRPLSFTIRSCPRGEAANKKATNNTKLSSLIILLVFSYIKCNKKTNLQLFIFAGLIDW